MSYRNKAVENFLVQVIGFLLKFLLYGVSQLSTIANCASVGNPCFQICLEISEAKVSSLVIVHFVSKL